MVVFKRCRCILIEFIRNGGADKIPDGFSELKVTFLLMYSGDKAIIKPARPGQRTAKVRGEPHHVITAETHIHTCYSFFLWLFGHNIHNSTGLCDADHKAGRSLYKFYFIHHGNILLLVPPDTARAIPEY